MSIEAMKLALDALERGRPQIVGVLVQQDQDNAIATLRQAIAEADQAEPVAWRTFDGEGNYEYCTYEMNENYAKEWAKRNPNHADWVDPLYAHPPTRKPVAWLSQGGDVSRSKKHFEEMGFTNLIALYMHPPARKPLTDGEVFNMAADYYEGYGFKALEFARAIERAHGITSD